MTDSLIVRVIQRYHPDWEPPAEVYSRTWLPCRCPFHGDEHASAGVSYQDQAFNCMACEMSGGPVLLIMKQEGVRYSEAKRIAKEVSQSGSSPIPTESPRQPSRGVSEDQGSGEHVTRSPSRDRQVPSRLRGRSAPRR